MKIFALKVSNTGKENALPIATLGSNVCVRIHGSGFIWIGSAFG